MPIIPLKQKAYVRKLIEGNNNGWNTHDYGDPIEYDVRAVEKIDVVVNQLGEEVTSSVKLTFDKLPDIAFTDLISYTNELGVEFKREPLAIKPIRMINGKPALTGVWL